jgi:hypothetical protein
LSSLRRASSVISELPTAPSWYRPVSPVLLVISVSNIAMFVILIIGFPAPNSEVLHHVLPLTKLYNFWAPVSWSGWPLIYVAGCWIIFVEGIDHAIKAVDMNASNAHAELVSAAKQIAWHDIAAAYGFTTV